MCRRKEFYRRNLCLFGTGDASHYRDRLPRLAGSRKLSPFIHSGTTAFFVFNMVIFFLWPVLADTKLHKILDPIYSALCHRMPSRCFWLDGEPMPVCARCFGIWIGLGTAGLAALFGAEELRLWRYSFGVLLIIVALIDFKLRMIMPENWAIERTITGCFAGFGGYVVWTLALKYLFRLSEKLNPKPSNNHISHGNINK